MLSAFLLILAPAVAAGGLPARPIQEFRQGPMPAENIWLRPAHPGSDDRVLPDIAIGDLRIDGDTLYVRVLNKGQSSTPGPVLVAARAMANGSKTDLLEQRTAKLFPGEARWVPLRGFSVRTATTSPTVFALESASVVSAVARLMPASTPVLDRSGQSRDVGTADVDESNNTLTRTGDSIKHGRPQ